MPNLVPLRAASRTLPAIVAAADGDARERFLEFFASNIRNRHTRRAYLTAVEDFLDWCEQANVGSFREVRPLHVAAWVEQQTQTHKPPTAKLRLAAIRHLFDWLVNGQVVPVNPAASVRGPTHVVRKGQTPMLEPKEARKLLDSIDTSTADRAARSRPAGADGLLVCPRRRRARHAAGGSLHGTPTALGPPARERR